MDGLTDEGQFYNPLPLRGGGLKKYWTTLVVLMGLDPRSLWRVPVVRNNEISTLLSQYRSIKLSLDLFQ